MGFVGSPLDCSWWCVCVKASNATVDWIEHDLRSAPFAYYRHCRLTHGTLRKPHRPSHRPFTSQGRQDKGTKKDPVTICVTTCDLALTCVDVVVCPFLC